MSKRYVGMALVVVLAVCVTAAQAAEQGGRGGRGGRGGGFGGPFGGFGGGPRGGGLLMLLAVEEVQKECEVIDDQLTDIRGIGERLRTQRGPGERPNFREMSEAEREKFMQQMQQQRQERAKKEREELAKILLPNQLERLEEISLQTQGIGALNNPDVAAKLNISPEQKQKIETTLQENMQAMGERMRALFQGGDREGIRDKMTAMRKEMEGKVLAVLSADQKKQFEEMKGEPFEMPQRGFMFGGRGGGRGGEAGPGRGGRGGGDRGRGDRAKGRPQRPDEV